MDKYQEALERARELHEAGNALTKSQMEIVFPELKESEDERIRKELVYFIQKEKEYMESKVKPENSPRLMFFMDALAYLERQNEQKPAEWSEEDDKMLNAIIDDIHCGTDFNAEVMHEANEREKWLRERFKSLRPQPSWKPSEQQMRCLLDCVSKAKEIHNASVGGYDAYRILMSLYDELHKLL